MFLYIFVQKQQFCVKIQIEISYLLTDYLGFEYTIYPYQKEICSNFYSFEFDIQLIQKWISFLLLKTILKERMVLW